MRYIAFLRAINVGGHVVKMDALKKSFVRLGFKDVDTFIASGNVLFSSPEEDTARLERQIERRLHKDLGYEVATFVRTTDDVLALAGYQAFPADMTEAAAGLNVGFLAAPMTDEGMAALEKLATANDIFHTNGREWYWLSHTKQSQSVISNATIERMLKVRSTLRGMNTIVRLAGRLKTAPVRKGLALRRTKRR